MQPEDRRASNLFNRTPIRVEGGIPIFSVTTDHYTRNYERIAGDHLRSLAEHGTNPWIAETLWREMEATTISLIERYSRPGQRILDVGVGLGRTLAHFPALQRHGMDISLGYLAKARDQGIDVCFARIEDIPFVENAFDLIVCTDVLEHVLDVNLCCRKMLSVLKPDGILIVRVPVRENLRPYLDPSYPYEYVHLRTFDEYSLQLLFGRILGCECLDILPAGYSPSRDRLKALLPFGREVSYAIRLWDGVRALQPLYSRLVRLLYNPIDMNIVVRKPPVDTGAGGVAAS